MSHTPGPWEYEVDREAKDGSMGGFSIYADRSVGDGNIVLSSEQCEGNYPGNISANARLISAAPDLLECARDLVWNYEWSGKNKSILAQEELVKKFISAIKKAEGK